MSAMNLACPEPVEGALAGVGACVACSSMEPPKGAFKAKLACLRPFVQSDDSWPGTEEPCIGLGQGTGQLLEADFPAQGFPQAGEPIPQVVPEHLGPKAPVDAQQEGAVKESGPALAALGAAKNLAPAQDEVRASGPGKAIVGVAGGIFPTAEGSFQAEAPQHFQDRPGQREVRLVQ